MDPKESVEPTMLVDGFDAAIVGILHGSDPVRVVYDTKKMVEILSAEMSEEDAWEYLEYNVFCAYVGEGTPMYVHPSTKEDIEYCLS